MKKKLELNKLEIQSFLTDPEKKQVDGGNDLGSVSPPICTCVCCTKIC